MFFHFIFYFQRARCILSYRHNYHDILYLEVYDDLPVVEDLSGVRVDDDDLMAISSRLKKAKKAKKKKVRFNS